MEQNKQLTLGSLFDGSGGFPLAAILYGIKPVWASEIEPFPIRVTTKRIPSMKHYGDITQMDGAKIEPVDIITFGSPCQDMSIAGKRAGLEGSRSNLFFEAIRIIKEMREATDGKKPRYIVWENVEGAFSSNKGEDFRCVLEQIVNVKDPAVTIPKPESGMWESAGAIVLGKSFSLAWRLYNAQYWGVPQRRKRIYLVADFRGENASKILFESEGLSRYTTESCRAWERFADRITASVRDASAAENKIVCLNDQGGKSINISENITGTLRAQDHGHPPIIADALLFDNHAKDCRYDGPLDVAPTITAQYGTGGNNQSFIVTPKTLKICSGCEGNGKGALVQNDLSATLDTHNGQTVFVPAATYNVTKEGGRETDVFPILDTNGETSLYSNQGGVAVICGNKDNAKVLCIDQGGGKSSCNITEDVSSTLTCTHGGEPAICLQGNMIGRAANNGLKGSGYSLDKSFALTATDTHGVVYAMSRADYNMGKNAKFGMDVSEEVSPPIIARGPSAVAHTIYSTSKSSYHMEASEDAANTLVATDYKDPPIVTSYPYYVVRRLTPIECARLQGFPDWWCADLETEHPTKEDILYWHDIFAMYAKTTGCKARSLKSVAAWLRHPYSDAAEYKMWGNGVALPCVAFVLAGIEYFNSIEESDE